MMAILALRRSKVLFLASMGTIYIDSRSVIVLFIHKVLKEIMTKIYVKNRKADQHFILTIATFLVWQQKSRENTEKRLTHFKRNLIRHGYSWVNNTKPGCYCLRIHVSVR